MKVKITQLHPTLCDPMNLYSPWNSPGQNAGVGNRSLFQGIFPTQGLNPGFLNCRCILYQLSHQGSPRILEWVAYPFSRGSSQTRDPTRVSCIAGRFFTIWEVGNGNSLQYSCLENSWDRGAWWAIVHGVSKSGALTYNHMYTILF